MPIFLSWFQQDAAVTRALPRDLLRALGLLSDLKVQSWEDSPLTWEMKVTARIGDRLDGADFGPLLFGSRYFCRPLIRWDELSRFAGQGADKGALPVALSPLSQLPRISRLGGIKGQVLFPPEDCNVAELSGARRASSANDLAASIRRRRLVGNGYRSL